jgi:hypothetical protein
MTALSKSLAVSMLLLAGPAFARDTKYLIKIADVLAMPDAAGKLDSKIKFYFGKQKAPAGENRGEVVANPKTNASNKSDEEACRWVALSALMELQTRARAMGATAVVGIESFYKKVPYSSEIEFECHAGTFMAGLALRGTLQK